MRPTTTTTNSSTHSRAAATPGTLMRRIAWNTGASRVASSAATRIGITTRLTKPSRYTTTPMPMTTATSRQDQAAATVSP